MPFTAPTSAEFTTRFPAFAGVATYVIDTALTEAAAYADNSWVSEADFRLARMLIAAHVLTCDGLGQTVEAELARAGDFTLYKSGGLTLETKAGGQQTAWLDKTTYGRRYLAVRTRSTPAIAVLS